MLPSHLTFYLFCLLLLYQLYLVLRHFVPLLQFNQETKPTEQAVSVIICAHNELPNLQKNLTSVLTQTHQNFEVIVVDDRSHDGSYEWLIDLKATFTHLKVIRIDEVPHHFNSKKYAITIGVKAASHELLLFTDADCKINSEHWVDIMSQSFTEKTNFVLGVSLYEKHNGFLNLFIRYETYQTALLYLSRALAGKPYMGVGRNMAYRKSLFLEKKGFYGFQQLTGGDDDLLINKHATGVNTRICTAQNTVNYSSPKMSWHDLINQKKRHYAVGKYYKNRDKLFLGMLQLSTVLTYSLFIIILYQPETIFIYISILLMILRFIGQYVVYVKLSTKFGDDFKPWLLPILELYYSFFHAIIGLWAVSSKSIRWK